MKKILALILMLLMLVTMFAGCQKAPAEEQAKEPAKEEKTAEKAPAEKVEEPLVIDWMLFDTPTLQDNFDKYQKDSPVYKYLCEKNNVELAPVGLAEDQVQVRIVGKDLGDLISINDKEQLAALIESDSIYSLNELVEQYAPHIKTDHKGRWMMSQGLYTKNDGTVYALSIQAGAQGWGYTNGRYLYNVRWDLYKKLGYPKIKDQYDLVEVLADMVELQPKTEDGKKVYGTAFALAPTHYWHFVGPIYSTFGYKANSSDFLFVDIDNNETMTYGAYDADSPFYIAADYFNKAYRAGILDPDSFTMQAADLNAKRQSGQVLSTLYYDQTYEKAQLEKDPKSIAGWGAIPVDGAWLWQDDNMLGWGVSYALAIPKTCEDPARVMKFLGWCFSEEGSRTLESGVQGEQWDYDAKGVPTYTKETLAMMDADPEAQMKLGLLQPLSNLGGFCSGAKHSDGYGMSLTTEEAYILRMKMTPCQIDYCEYYDSRWPNEHMIRRVESGEMNALSRRTMAGDFAAPTEDIARIDSACMQISLEAIPKLVQAPDDATYQAIKAETIAKMDAAGAVKAKEYYASHYAATLKPVK